MSEHDIKMQALTENTVFDYDSHDDIRLHLNDEYRINVYAADMSKKEYKDMQKDLNKTIIGKGYSVTAWNNSSGYEYWSEDKNEANYIMITVHVNDISLVNKEDMNRDAIKLFYHFSQYDNQEYHNFGDE